MKLDNKIAVVTGASLGIGRAVAIDLARNGADVVVNYSRHADEAGSVVREIENLGRRAYAVQASVADRSQCVRLVEETVRRFGSLDILVSNAAFSIRKPFLDLEPGDIEKTWAVSLWGVFYCCQLAARRMVGQQGGGSMVVISSVHAARPYPHASAYNGAKAAVSHMALSWARELIQYGIRVNVVEPGWTDTPGERAFNTEDQIREGARSVPIGRLARPDEIAKGVTFLVSEKDASYITGSTLRIDGGFVLVH
ncbi:MAG: SDR family oxidoreductase [Bryobacteraceae bacterium]|nr:SDR family oxidoreductase [Bryobacteraceae bacterium]